MFTSQHKKYFLLSVIFHFTILLILIMGFDVSTNLPVFENTDKHDIISAVVLGDTTKSKILPNKITSKPQVKKEIEKPVPKPIIESQPKKINIPKKDVIALKVEKKKIEPKPKANKLPNELFAKDLLADINKQRNKQKIKQKNLQSKFKETLQAETEKTLRQNLLDEEIKLQGQESRQSQGEVDKYKALILQAISEHWIIPTQANKKLYCELMIRTAPGGMVLDVQITKTSGDPSLDSSARAAVLKASPLPVPPKADDFEAFRQFVLKVKPENIL